MLYYCFSRVQPLAAWFLQFCWLKTHILAGIDSLNLVVIWVQLWPVGGLSLRRNEVESFAQQLLNILCAHHALVQAWAVLYCWKANIILLSTTRLITANICWDSKVSYQYCPSTFYLRLDKEQLPLLIDSDRHHNRLGKRWVCGNRRRSCLVHTADSCENEGQLSCDQTCFLCLLAKQLSAFKWKDAIFGFLFSQVVQQH